MNVSQSLIKRLGSKYMPANAVHWSDLPEDRKAKILEKAPDIADKHFDWLFLKVQRSWTTWWAPYPPRKIRGNAVEVMWTAEDGTEYPYCKPVPLPGEWFETAGRDDSIVGYWASTSEDGSINRRGARFDDGPAGYLTFPSFRAGSVTNFFKELFT